MTPGSKTFGIHVLEHFDEFPGRLGALAEVVGSGQLRVPIQVFPLDQASPAHELIESGASVGKIVLHVTH